jgi:hypothetical protein
MAGLSSPVDGGYDASTVMLPGVRAAAVVSRKTHKKERIGDAMTNGHGVTSASYFDLVVLGKLRLSAPRIFRVAQFGSQAV